MRIAIVGGGIAAAHIANKIKEHDPSHEVRIVSKEPYRPYDRIHLCSLVKESMRVDEICMPPPKRSSPKRGTVSDTTN